MIDKQIIEQSIARIKAADKIIIGAGSGLSTAAGLNYGGKRFQDNFADFISKYPLSDMYSAAFYPFATPEERWAYFSRHILINRFNALVGQPYKDLLEVVQHKDYFVLTTNVDAQFQRAGFNTSKLFATQGDYGMFQCSKPCNNTLYHNHKMVNDMAAQQSHCKIPSALIPICPNCGEALEPHLRKDQYFVENDDWHTANNNYINYVRQIKQEKVVFLELGVGFNTPSIIRWPFEQLSKQLTNACLIRVNMDDVQANYQISDQSILCQGDIAEFITGIKKGILQ
ncbi:SIR2 family NAD-dependent protein deacylase [Saccharicrinis aurantiacus]|uniref:SIR2 family NAD-dependent protein deacylase n=1 Tax=Saccharicrinis aurantiacus TaxID=1849719 RepID=UPI00094FD2A0|nr:Sir2 silent information regulator family NAD-dependent deacetylase [Saccharicrinis aurantiacus]